MELYKILFIEKKNLQFDSFYDARLSTLYLELLGNIRWILSGCLYVAIFMSRASFFRHKDRREAPWYFGVKSHLVVHTHW